MAKMYGISLSKVKSFKGHEGETCKQGEIHLDGKKVGFFSDDSWSGGTNIDFDSPELKKTVEERVALWFTHHPEKEEYLQDTEIFIYHLKCLMEDEKAYKRELKKGYDKYACQDDYPYKSCFYPAQWTKEQAVANMDAEKLNIRYFSLEDFDIKVPTE